MTFENILQNIDLAQIRDSIYAVSERDVKNTLQKKHFSITDLPVLISHAAAPFLEKMAVMAQQITFLRFGKTVKLYAPLYVSNECVNECAYCGFNKNNEIERITLKKEDVFKEADALYIQGFRHILLVSGEDRDKVSVSFLADIVRELSRKFAAVSIEVYPMDVADYHRLVLSGVTGIALYQETYHRDIYRTLHKGPKADFNYRLGTHERAGVAGFRELGIAALIGLADFRVDMACVALHARYLMKRFWETQVAVSFPRLRFAAGGFRPPVSVSDRELAQAVFALRLVLPDVDLVLSTREKPEFRDGMAGVGITRISAGSKTNPGGYALVDNSLEQFQVADSRTPAEVASMLDSKGLEPVWKDFDPHFLNDS
jgi:2-iminoacetate synthase